MYSSTDVHKKQKKQLWTEQEDSMLSELISKYGTQNWVIIAQGLPNRSGKQCRERYLNRLKPGLNKSAFTIEEDNLIIEKQKELGNQWVKIAQYFKGRSPDSIKNRFSWLRIKNAKAGSQRENSLIIINDKSYTGQEIKIDESPISMPSEFGTPVYAEKVLPPPLPSIYETLSPQVQNQSIQTIPSPKQVTTANNNCELTPSGQNGSGKDDLYLFLHNDPVAAKRDPNCFWKIII